MVAGPYAIVLNGTSSAGKTSIALELQRRRPEVWFHASIDTFLNMLPLGERIDEIEAELLPIGMGVHAAMGALAKAGNRVIVDHVFAMPAIEPLLRSALDGVPSLWVGVHCPLEELERRERARGDREVGAARRQIDVVHQGVAYDLELDTSLLDRTACVEVIGRHLDG
ncbi:MAG TPA: AAA family ATPase [Acidimicrobiales bacterium]|nr:AAA family ATPase [Acidimicrobiales bacterium]